MKHTCNHCGASFLIVERFSGHGEISRCGEPICRLRMRSLVRTPHPVRMEVEAQDVAPLEGVA